MSCNFRCTIEGCPIEGCPIEGCPIEGCPIEGCPIEGCPIEGCPIEGCPMRGCAKLGNDMKLRVRFLVSEVLHKKGEKSSYKGRHLRNANRPVLGVYKGENPSEKFHSLISDPSKTNMNSVLLMSASKNVSVG